MDHYASNYDLRPVIVGNGSVTLAGRIKGAMYKVALPSPARNAPKVTRVRGLSKVHRRGPSSTATSSRTTSTGKTITIIAATLVSVSVGAALSLGSLNVQGESSAGEESSGNSDDHATNHKDDSEKNGLGEFHLFSSLSISDLASTVGEGFPPYDNPNNPPGTSNGAGMLHFFTSFGHGAHISLAIS